MTIKTYANISIPKEYALSPEIAKAFAVGRIASFTEKNKWNKDIMAPYKALEFANAVDTLNTEAKSIYDAFQAGFGQRSLFVTQEAEEEMMRADTNRYVSRIKDVATKVQEPNLSEYFTAFVRNFGVSQLPKTKYGLVSLAEYNFARDAQKSLESMLGKSDFVDLCPVEGESDTFLVYTESAGKPHQYTLVDDELVSGWLYEAPKSWVQRQQAKPASANQEIFSPMNYDASVGKTKNPGINSTARNVAPLRKAS